MNGWVGAGWREMRYVTCGVILGRAWACWVRVLGARLCVCGGVVFEMVGVYVLFYRNSSNDDDDDDDADD